MLSMQLNKWNRKIEFALKTLHIQHEEVGTMHSYSHLNISANCHLYLDTFTKNTVITANCSFYQQPSVYRNLCGLFLRHFFVS